MRRAPPRSQAAGNGAGLARPSGAQATHDAMVPAFHAGLSSVLPPGDMAGDLFWGDVGDGEIPMREKDLEAALLLFLVAILIGPELLDRRFLIRIRRGGEG